MDLRGFPSDDRRLAFPVPEPYVPLRIYHGNLTIRMAGQMVVLRNHPGVVRDVPVYRGNDLGGTLLLAEAG